MLNEFFMRTLHNYPIARDTIKKNIILLVRFASVDILNEVLQVGFQQFDKNPFIVKHRTLHEQKEKAKNVLVWVQFAELGLENYELTSLRKLASTLGALIMAIENIMSKDRIDFARAIIDVTVTKEVLKTAILLG